MSIPKSLFRSCRVLRIRCYFVMVAAWSVRASAITAFPRGVQSNGWSVHVPSDVTGELGKMVILPCTFTHPYKTFDRTLTAIWRIKEPYNGTIVFKCVSQSTSELCKTAISYKNKYKLLGNPRYKDLSIRIDNLTWSDSERYFCRVELYKAAFDWSETKETAKRRLQESTVVALSWTMWRSSQSEKVTSCTSAYIADAAPRIINITVSSNGDRTFQARCTAEGEPAPALTWTGPPYSNLTSITSMNHRVTKELRYLTHDGKYTCTAVNSHGRAEGAVYFYKFKASNSSFFLILIFVPLGIKVLILLVILGFTVFSRGGHSCKTPLTRTLTADTAAARLCRQKEQHRDAAEDLGGLIRTRLH
ncbi:PREDICTED: sialic acid-binding Ig-like lectin 15, partial [Fulmarus glacialis]|uniref:sialic acid-binding Ig-like lectin 15 n=1 Tax=Fulmarus glacialis TaxID=30455 RepID=UPI00051B63D0